MKDQFKDWESICDVGHNLHRLLVLQETKLPQRPENPLDKDIAPPRSGSKIMPRKTPVGFGDLSHATSHSFMNNAENAQYLSGWSLTPTKITDELKTYLFTEQQAQEWDVLSQKEWQDMENVMAEDPVLIGEKRRENTGLDDGRSYLTSSTANRRGSGQSEGGEGRKKGVNGWTRVKSRSDDVVSKAILE